MSEEIQTLGVVGAGQMGAGIAQVAAQAGWSVRLGDATEALASAGRARILTQLRRLVDKGKSTPEELQAVSERLLAVGSLSDLGPCDLVVEAASERLEVKLELFRALDVAVKPGAVLASNTSSISLTRLAAETKRPERVVGLHFMNPVPLMKLVEVIRALQTSDGTYQLALAVARRMNKTTITSRDAPGFLVNRMLIPFLNEAIFALESGVGSAADIDTGAKLGLNHPLGPLELADLIGLDTVLAIAEVLQRDLGDDKYRPAALLRNHVAAGWLGRKSGRGFYTYEKG